MSSYRPRSKAPGCFIKKRSRNLPMTEDGGFIPCGQQVIAHPPQDTLAKPTRCSGALRWLIDDDTATLVTAICARLDGG
jgi:hypothetical protein